MFKKLIYAGSIGFLLFSCGPGPESEENTSASNVQTTEIGQVEEADSTLQSVEELTLRATGNSLDDIRFNKDTLKVQAGELVKLKFINEGVDQSMIHNVVITKLGKYQEVALAGEKEGAPGKYLPDDSTYVIEASPLALPGQTVVMEFQAPKDTGNYDFVCTYPEHWKRMHGKLIVN